MRAKYTILIIICFVVSSFTTKAENKEFTIPQAAMIELYRLEEAYNILDQFSEKIWPGWNNYKEFPFLFDFQNGLRILIGHPAPPYEFHEYKNMLVSGLKVYVDTTNLTDFEIKHPFFCGGGIYSLGRARIVNLNFRKDEQVEKNEKIKLTSERHILVFIHELLHCYQFNGIKAPYGNLRLNADNNFAVFSEIEGLALQKAYLEKNREDALLYIKDFAIARKLKQVDFNEREIGEHACDELREGMAVFSEFMVLQLIKNGFKSVLSKDKDPYYSRFANRTDLIDTYNNRLKEYTPKSLEMYEKCYEYGCFQALMLQEFFPGWQKDISDGGMFDQTLINKLNISKQDSLNALNRFKSIYNLSELKTKHANVIDERNKAYKEITSREGMVYIFNFKPIKEYLELTLDKSLLSYKLGLFQLFPEGIPELNIDGIHIKIKDIPIEINQLYHIKLVNTEWKKGKKAYSISYGSKTEEGVYKDVKIQTPIFDISAPQIRIKEREERIKISFLSRV